MKDYADYDALGLAALVKTRQVSASELLEAALMRAEAAQKIVNCFSAIMADAARAQVKSGIGDGPFAGVPFATKDLAVEIKGFPLTSGCRAFADNVAAIDGELAARYRKAGFVFFGVTTTPEFGLTTATESALFGITRNPWDLGRTSGGSSGGASACVAAGVVPLAQASDGGGSVRIPAACTGLVGLKPSRGRVPLGPRRTEGWNGLSVVHAVSRTVRDSAALLDASHGPETGSRYAAPPVAESFLAASQRDPARLRIALWQTAPNGVRGDADAEAGLVSTSTLLAHLGHTVVQDGPALDGAALGKGMLWCCRRRWQRWQTNGRQRSAGRLNRTSLSR
jgi:amidase